MKKSLIALTVAGLFAAPAFAASGNVDVYGKLRVSLSYIDVDGGDSFWSVDDETSRIGFKGAEDLGGGLKAIWQVEQSLSSSVNLLNTNQGVGTGSLANRNTFVGLAGDFGTFLVGRHDTPYKLAGSADLFADTLADSQNGTKNSSIIGYDVSQVGIGGFDMRVSNAIAYVSPSFSGLTVIAAVVPGANALGSGNNGQYAASLADAYSLAAVYGNGPLSLSAGYEKHTGDLFDEATSVAGHDDEDAWKINAGYTIGDLKLGATYENQNGLGAAESDNWLVSAAYGMGPITLAAQYGSRDANGSNHDLDRWTVGMIYGLSKRTNVAIAYNSDDNGTGSTTPDIQAFTMQLNHDF